MKRYVILALGALLLFTLAGCEDNADLDDPPLSTEAPELDAMEELASIVGVWTYVKTTEGEAGEVSLENMVVRLTADGNFSAIYISCANIREGKYCQ